mgnify:CR=1 FL=1
MRVASTLDALIAGLRGRLCAGIDWEAVIALANHTLLTPALFSSLTSAGNTDQIPDDVREYLQFIHDYNRERNQRLRGQLSEAVIALNRAGIVPILLKGAVPLFISSPDHLPTRMTSDLDLAVEGDEMAAAQACVERIGYLPVAGDRCLTRSQDVGTLELRPHRPVSLERAIPVEREGMQVKIPTAQSRALHWIMHDLIKEGDYWRGRIDLRHLHDLAELADRDGVDWGQLRASAPDRSVRNAIDTQLLTLHRFFGTEIPAECARNPVAHLQCWRRIFTARHPLIGAPLRLSGNLSWGVRRLFRPDERPPRGAIDLSRRIVRTLLNARTRSKI